MIGKPLIAEKHHTLQVNLPKETVAIEVDPLRVSQAIANLLTNAAKYTKPVLVVDDNRDSADALALLLESDGYVVITGYSGTDALLLASQQHPDAVILDIGMSDVTGYEDARRLRREAWGRDMQRLLAEFDAGKREARERHRHRHRHRDPTT